MSDDQELARILIQIDKEVNSYQDTVWGLLAFAHEMLWDDPSRCPGDDDRSCFGRKMTTSPSNRISPDTDVTPDLVVQINDDLGYVAEAKIGLCPANSDDALEYRQICKYDDDLTGWFTDDEKISNHDVVLLVHETRQIDVEDDISSHISSGSLSLSRRFAVVGFARLQQVDEFIHLRRGFGELSDPVKDDKLRRAVQIKCEYLAAKSENDYLLYDDPPPLPILMTLLWEDTFHTLVSLPDYVQQRTRGNPVIVISANELTEEVSNRMYPYMRDDHRRPSIPRVKWIRNALDGFVKLGWAKIDDSGNYEIELNLRRNPYGQFRKYAARRRLEQQKARETALEKLPLFSQQIASGEFGESPSDIPSK